MRTARFLTLLPGLFDAFPGSQTPRARVSQSLLASVDGLSAENNLALLALAAEHLDPGEVYVEAGTHKGLTLIAAALESRAEFHALDDFSYETSSRSDLEANLTRFGVSDRVQIHEGDTSALLAGDVLAGARIGAFFYDAAHTTEATLAALRDVCRHLAPEALIVIDDSDWTEVRDAAAQFMSGEPRVRRALRIDGRAAGQEWWWDGMDLLVWQCARQDSNLRPDD